MDPNQPGNDPALPRSDYDLKIPVEQGTQATPRHPVARVASVAVTAERAGDRIGPYALIERIGMGGFGVVWRAERREPYVQQVAIKLLRPGMDSEAVLARFEQERQALAMMDHPNIAKVIDGGITETGRNYFVMELVKGEPITAFCDRNQLGIEKRLQLFAQVCDAIQHAHMKGVIHRDLKPGNILASMGDTGAGAPFNARVTVIDFGVAKATSPGLTARQIFTETGQMVGTPEYMSPEQADGGLDLDTRTDIYSLGVVLYELLVGAPPFDAVTLRSAGMAAMHRIIRESDPLRPSERLGSLSRAANAAQVQKAVAEIARGRGVKSDALIRLLRQELEWLPMKAMRKERSERYRSAAEFGDDVRNYLGGRALLAGPESAAYRAKKFVRRHRIGVLSAALIAASLVAAAVVSTWFGVREARARALAVQRLDEQQRVAAFQRSMLAGLNPEHEGRAWRAWLVQRLTDKLQSAEGSARAQDRARRLAEFESNMVALNTTDAATAFLAQVVDGARPTIDADFRQMPQVRADLLQAVVQIKLGLGLQSDPELWPTQQSVLELRRAAASERPADLFDALYWCGEVKRLQGGAKSTDEALLFAREALAGRQSLDPAQPEAVAQSLLQIANLTASDESIDAFRGVVEGNAYLPATRVRAAIGLGERLAEAGSREEALRVLEKARGQHERVGEDRAASADLRLNIGFALERLATSLPPVERAAKLDEAVRQYEQALELHAALYGDDHSITIETRNSLALALMGIGTPAAMLRARGMLDENCKRVRANQPPEEMVQALNTLSMALLREGKTEEADRLSQQVIQAARQFYETGSEPMVRTSKMRALILIQAGKTAEAESLLADLLRARLEWMSKHAVRGYDRLALDVGCDLLRARVALGDFARMDEVFQVCDPNAAAGDDAQNDGKYNYLKEKAATLKAWSARDATMRSEADRADKVVRDVAVARRAAGKDS